MCTRVFFSGYLFAYDNMVISCFFVCVLIRLSYSFISSLSLVYFVAKRAVSLASLLVITRKEAVVMTPRLHVLGNHRTRCWSLLEVHEKDDCRAAATDFFTPVYGYTISSSSLLAGQT